VADQCAMHCLVMCDACMQEFKRLGWACCKAVEVLHAAGITHTDIRGENTVWLGNDDAMLIDLERCRFESNELPADMKLVGWDDGTLHVEADDKKRYTYSSDMYSIGKMLHEMMERQSVNMSDAAKSFTSKLMAKQLSAAQALAHEWLSGLS
jgi:hypothetical protein